MSLHTQFKLEPKQPIQESIYDNTFKKSRKSSISVKLSAKASEYRKNTKPLMEKRRRERINRSLDELKNIILNQTNHNPIRNHKLEKADILELTVKHLKNLQKQKLNVSANEDPNVKSKYKLGYYECVQECLKFLSTDSIRSDSAANDIDDSIRQRLIVNLYKQYQSLNTDNFSNLIQEEFLNETNFFSPNNFMQSINQCHETITNPTSCSELNVSKDSDFNNLNVNSQKSESFDCNDSKVWRPW
ncbi:unnamed protein product [Brachionus calyciflorus]|uniref:BHLH domain-containing protein n=1 Tax=Brachionus calyciflorus TaxID=104777 RepID=A0A814FU00_9BILA|nr:unnamed protein product [Brachionus calyciflorus]